MISKIFRYLCLQYHKETGTDIGLETKAISTHYIIGFITYRIMHLNIRNIKIQRKVENKQNNRIFSTIYSWPILSFNKYLLNT